jgi:fatty acid desaturase
VKTAPPAAELLSAEQIAMCRQRSDLWGAALVLHAWAVIALAMWLVARWPNPLTLVLAVMLIGSRQLGLLILMHDGAHGMLARSPRWNRLLAQGVCAWPTFADADAYRRYHLRHHAHTMQAGDPDLVLTGHYPITRASLWRKLRRDLLGVTGLSQRRAQWRAALGRPEWRAGARLAHFWRSLGPQCLSNLCLFLALSAMGYWYFYPLLWLLPLLTWQQLVLRVRNIAEHAAVPDATDPLRYARDVRANGLERAFIAPYWVNYHLTHHLLMWVPCYRLPYAQACLLANGLGSRMARTRGYWAVLAEVTRADGGAGAGPPRARATGTFGEGFATE